MLRSWAILLCAFSLAVSGCAHTHLKHNTVKQGDTLSDIFTQQVLDNLAMFAANPSAVPSFAVPATGASQVVDQAGGSANPGAFTKSFWAFVGISGQRQIQESWQLVPITDPAKLRLMRCAYQRSLGVSCDPCFNCCKIEKGFYGKGNRNIKVYDPKTLKASIDSTTGFYPVDPLTGMPFVAVGEDGRIESILVDPRTGESYTEEKRTGEISIPAYDCNDPCNIRCGWVCYSEKWCDVPKCCRQQYGHYKGMYVWVPEEYRHELGKLVLAVVDYAMTAPPASATKTVKIYLNEAGAQVTKERATKVVEASLPINASELDTRKAFGLSTEDLQIRSDFLGLVLKDAEVGAAASPAAKLLFNSLNITVQPDGKVNKEALKLLTDMKADMDAALQNRNSAGTTSELITIPPQSIQYVFPNYLQLQQGLNTVTPMQMLQQP